VEDSVAFAFAFLNPRAASVLRRPRPRSPGSKTAAWSWYWFCPGCGVVGFTTLSRFRFVGLCGCDLLVELRAKDM
jgi:hypothetical protein